jgi:hypothetical protein
MTLDGTQELLASKVTGIASLNLSGEERQDALIEIGFIAAAIDTAAVGAPNENEIKANTDDAVTRAEKNVETCDFRDSLDVRLASRSRDAANRVKI